MKALIFSLLLVLWLGFFETSFAKEAVKTPLQQDDAPLLQKRLHDIHAMTADFSVRVELGDGTVSRVAQGELALQRPSRLYYKDESQVIVSDGKGIWYYYPELEQVVHQRDFSIQTGAPIFWIIQNKAAVSSNFEVKKEDEWHFLLSSTTGDIAERVRVGFSKKSGLLEVIELFYGNGAHATYRFSHVKYIAPRADLFSFTPPKGMDVIER